MRKRVFLIVLDSFGIGEMPDAEMFGDKGTNTLKTISQSTYFKADELQKLGLFNIDGIDFYEKSKNPIGAYGKFSEISRGKDTTTGHWEICGLISEKPFPTFPNGFPKEIIEEFEKKTGRGTLCNKPYSGTQVIKDYGEEHLKTGNLIVYTSADSVFQIAANEDIVPLNDLYEYCRMARDILVGPYAVGRVIARPFKGTCKDDFFRTSGRHDFSLTPFNPTILDCLKENGKDVISIGKINDIFASSGITEHYPSSGNTEGLHILSDLLSKDFYGLCFINLVDFDMLYGHRNDIDGYAKATSEFNEWLKNNLAEISSDDLLIITADHGCDPGFDKTTDHSREYIPMLAYSPSINPINLGTRQGFSDIGKTILDYFGISNDLSGNSFLSEIR